MPALQSWGTSFVLDHQVVVAPADKALDREDSLFGLVTAWRLPAADETLAVVGEDDGGRGAKPSAFSMTLGVAPSMTATQNGRAEVDADDLAMSVLSFRQISGPRSGARWGGAERPKPVRHFPVDPRTDCAPPAAFTAHIDGLPSAAERITIREAPTGTRSEPEGPARFPVSRRPRRLMARLCRHTTAHSAHFCTRKRPNLVSPRPSNASDHLQIRDIVGQIGPSHSFSHRGRHRR